jgi:AcrR family transcriptional regulator
MYNVYHQTTIYIATDNHDRARPVQRIMKKETDLPFETEQDGGPLPQKKSRRATARLPQAQRRAQILGKAYDFFAEHGLTAQTRALADACGISQRLLYSVFPNKAALIDALYETEIEGRFKAIWFVQLKDRSATVEQRLTEFYREYYNGVLQRRWLALFLHAALAEVTMAPAYAAKILSHLHEVIVEEAAHEAGLRLPEEIGQKREIGAILHGAISHLAIRRHIYQDASPVPVDSAIALSVKSFLGGLPAILPRA